MKTVDYSKLISDALNGNQKAFDELYTLTVQSAFRTAFLMLNNEDDAQDVLQNAYAKAFRKLSELKEPEKFESWLKSIVENESKNYIKKSKRISAPIVFAKNKVEDNSDEWNQPIPQEYLEREELRKSVSDILDGLSPEVRACIVLFHYENKTLNEISEILEIPLGTVKSRLYSGRKQIEKEFVKLQKKDPTLYSVAAIPAFIALLAIKAESITVPSALSQTVLASVTSAAVSASTAAGTVATAGTATAAGTTAVAGTAATVGSTAAAGTAIAAKVVAVAVAGSVAVGGTVAVKNHVDNKKVSEFSSAYSTTIPVEETCTVTQLLFETTTATHEETLTVPSQNETVQSQTNTLQNTTSAPVTTRAASTSVAGSTTRATTTAKPTEASTVTSKPTTTKVVTTVPTTAQPTTNPENNYSASNGVIISYDGTDSDVSIPSKVGSKTVTAVGAGAFSGNTAIRTVSLPSSVTQIGQEAFADCTSLASVSLPSSLELIGIGAFYGCEKLTAVSIPGGTKTISDEAFAQCTNLKSVTIPSSVTSISDDAFSGCDSLTIRCSEGSAAHSFAVDNGIPFTLI